MSDIRENQELRRTNVLSMRKWLTIPELQKEMERLDRFIESNNLRRSEAPISATFAVKMENGQQLMDVEILIPLDRSFEPPEGCVYKPVFELTNAVVIRHTGNPEALQDTYNTLINYLQKNNWQAVTSGYNVTIQEAKTQEEINNMIIDIYIGVKPNA